LPGEHGVSAPFNISDLTLFDVGDDSGSNTFEERGNDEDQPNTKRNHANDPLEENDEDRPNTNCNHVNDPLQLPMGPFTRARTKKLKEALNGLVQNIWSKMDLDELGTFKEHEGQPLIHLI
jgi:hypothetical protein